MTRLRHSRSSLFLIELIIAILFFSAGSAVCVRAFAQARLTSQAAADLSFASAQVSAAASAVRYTDGSAASLAEYFPGAQALPPEETGADAQTDYDSGNGAADGAGAQACAIWYDSDRQLCGSQEAAYTMTVRTAQSGSRTDASISMTGPDGEVIYELSLRYPTAPQKEDPGI